VEILVKKEKNLNIISKYKGLIFKLIIAILIIGIYTYSSGILINPKFDSNKWKSAELETSERYEMMKHLYRTHEFVGMKKTDVIKLFGEPDFAEGRAFQYYLKTSQKGTDTTSFSLGFDDSNKVMLTLITY